MLRASKTIGLSLLMALLTGCSGTTTAIDANATAPFVQTSDARDMAEARIPPVSGSRAQEVQASFVGSHDDIVAGLGPDLYVGGPVPAPEVQRYLEALRNKLIAQWPYDKPAVPFRVEILPSFGYAADSFADGVIRIPVGILQKSDSESEVAFVMGHEAAHLLLKHQIRREAQVGAAERVAQTMRYLGEFRAITKRKQTGVGSNIREYVKANAIIAGDTAAGLLVEDAIQVIFDAGWSRKQEAQADLIGIDLMTRAGYNPSYTDQVFDAVMNAENNAAPEEEELKKAVGGGPISLPALFDKYNPTNVMLRGIYSLNEQLKTLAISHPETVARKEAAGAYRDKYYATALGRTSKGEDGLARLKQGAAYTSMVQAITHARRANAQLARGDAGEALEEARAAEELAPNWWATHYLIACAMLNRDEMAAALANLERTLAMPGVPYGVFERAAFEFGSHGDVPSAFHVMEAAERRFGGPEVTWPDRIVLYRAEKNTGGADATLDTCNKSDNARQRDKCVEAARRPVELAASFTAADR